MFLIDKDKVIWLYGLGKGKIRPFAGANVQRSAYSRGRWILLGYNPAIKCLRFSSIFLKRVLNKFWGSPEDSGFT